MPVARTANGCWVAQAAAAAGASASLGVLVMLMLPTTAAAARRQGSNLVGRIGVPPGSGMRPPMIFPGFVRGPTLTHRCPPLLPAATAAAVGVSPCPTAIQALWEKAMMLAPARVITEVSSHGILSVFLLLWPWPLLLLVLFSPAGRYLTAAFRFPAEMRYLAAVAVTTAVTCVVDAGRS